MPIIIIYDYYEYCSMQITPKTGVLMFIVIRFYYAHLHKTINITFFDTVHFPCQ